MAAFLVDTFTGSNGTTIASHSPDTGGAWSLMSGFTDPWEIQGNVCRSAGATALSTQYSNAATPPTADYSISIVLKKFGTGGSNASSGVLGRIQGGNNGYYANYSVAAGGYRLFILNSGGFTQIGTTVSATPGDGDVMELRMVGSTISLYVNTVLLITGTDSSWTAAGVAGFRGFADNTANSWGFDTLVGDNLGAVAGHPAMRRFNMNRFRPVEIGREGVMVN